MLEGNRGLSSGCQWDSVSLCVCVCMFGVFLSEHPETNTTLRGPHYIDSGVYPKTLFCLRTVEELKRLQEEILEGRECNGCLELQMPSSRHSMDGTKPF